MLLVLYGCGRRSPEATYERIKQEVDAAEFDAALQEVDGALAHPGSHNPVWEWRLRIQKARILTSISKADDALAVLQPAPPASLASTEIPEQRELYRGVAHRYTQQFSEAEQDFEAAEKLAPTLGPYYTCQLLIDQADLWVDEGNYERAESNYHDAQIIAHGHSFSRLEATALADWARLAMKQSRFDEALDRSFDALRLAQSLKMEGNVATILGNLGWSYSDLGDFEASLEYFNQGAQESAKRGMSGYSAYWFSGAAGAYMALREYASAENLARSTLKSAMELNDAETTVLCLNTLAEIMLRTNRLAEGQHYNQEALKMEESGKDKLVTFGSLLLAGKLAAAAGHLADADGFFQRVLGASNIAPQARWEAQAGLAQVREGQGKPAEAERQYVKAIGTIEDARHSVNHDELRLSFLSSGIEVYGEYIGFLIRLHRPTEALNEAELSRARTLAEGVSSNAQSSSPGALPRAHPQQIAQRLNATLLFYWLGETHSYLWVITPTKTALLTLPPEPEIDLLVKSYREAVAESKDVMATGQAAGEKLYATLVAPAQKLIEKNPRVIVLPDGSLYGLNFETLIVSGPKPHFWIEDATLTTASSLTLLTSASTRTAPKGSSLLLVGNTLSPSADFPALPEAAAEIQDIEKYFPAQRREVLSGSQATPAAYLNSKPEQFAYLHFVTHGTASRARPLESAVILSKDKDEGSYKLYARDIVKRHLSAYLVTISACTGAGTRAYSGEGLVGLSWAFVRAGAHNVIAALWEVSDVSTPQLMDKLYEGLSHGEDPASALRAAKLSLLHSDSVFRKPYYWAPFQLYTGS
ncbi:MAG: CHAT domain-containing protein [Candidatus Acidiferrum sp.]